MFNMHKFKEKVFEVGGKIIGGIAESFGLSIGKKVFPPHGGSNHDSALAAAISSNKAFIDIHNSFVAVQAEQNKLQKAGLVLSAIELAQKAEIAQKDRELRKELCEITCNFQREIQQNEFQNRRELQAVQIQADFDEKNLPTVFSRQELVDIFAQKSDLPLFVCSKIQITEGSPRYFQTELAAEVESKMRTFANSTFRRDVRFYSRFFKDRDVFDADVEKLRSIIPDTPCVMSFSRLTRSNVHFHYKLWGSQIAEILHEHYDLEFSWREEFLQPLLDSMGEVSDHDLDNIYEMIGDWLTTLQKIYAVFFIDLYALVDGDNPFYATKLDSVNVGLPEDIAGQYIQPLMEILQRVQNERIEAFNEELRRQQEQEERKRREELQKQQNATETTTALDSKALTIYKAKPKIDWVCLHTIDHYFDIQHFGKYKNTEVQIAIHPNREEMASLGKDGIVKIWDLKTGNKIATLLKTHPIEYGTVPSIRFHPKRNILFGAGHDGLWYWEFTDPYTYQSTQSLMKRESHLDSYRLIEYNSNDNILLFMKSGSYPWSLLETPEGGFQELYYLIDSNILDIKILNSNTFISGLNTGYIQIFQNPLNKQNSQEFVRFFRFKGHSEAIFNICVSPNRHIFASSSKDGKVKLWESQAGELIHSFDHKAYAITFSRDGQVLGSASEDIQLWNVETKELITTLSGHSKPIQDIAFSSDGNILVSCSKDGEIKIWRCTND
ncbi:MAG: WD40 repeat domain-containing protein [Pseudanabaenaceae cyanobacterium bins.39]|nr:WD40 repeat domain-containing protein [Pseudanabaenaceae cyanobacterium bins.39]